MEARGTGCPKATNLLGEPKGKLSNTNQTKGNGQTTKTSRPKQETKTRIGVDIGINWDKSTDELVAALKPCVTDNLGLQMISNRGTKVWPDGNPDTFCSDNWRLRFMSTDENHIKTSQVVALMSRMNDAGLNFTKSVMLNNYDDVPGFTVAQGE